MDKVFARFLEKFEGVTGRREVPASSIEHYTGKLPGLLLDYWREHGWCGYGDGIFWIVDPQHYEGVGASWIEGTQLESIDTFHLVGRSAFGDLYFWGERTGPSLSIDSVFSRYVFQDLGITTDKMDRAVQIFLLTKSVDSNDFEGMFKRAKKKLGLLAPDEMYGFVPAIMLRGSDAFEHLKKVKAVEHLMILSQLAELEPYDFPDF